MFENFIIIEKKKTIGGKIVAILLLFFMLIFFYLGTVISPFIFEIPGIACGIGWYLITFRSGLEYEYSYFDGELKITKIRNKKRRKRVETIDLNKVILVAPKESESLKKYNENHETHFINYTSRNIHAKVYELITNKEDGTNLISFEPDEKMLDAMRTKYSRIIIK